MKKVIIALIFIASLAFAAAAQQKALTQAEYVKMLYALEKQPSMKTSIVEAIRTRGIDFVVTDGLRGLTRTKSANDDELKRALDEADRRRSNPAASTLPSATETTELIKRTRFNTLQAVGEMPDFVVKQQIQRSAAYAGTGTFQPQDQLVVAVSYRSTGEESYRVLSRDGVPQTDSQSRGSYDQVGGTSSTGEFVTMIDVIFKPDSEATFTPVDTDVIRGHRAVIFEFSVDKDKAQQRIVSSGSLPASTISGMSGRIWIDREIARVLKVESIATGIPEGFPITSARRVIDYDWATISGEKYLLPLISDVRLTFREGAKVYETRNQIRFKEYQKFGTDVIVVEDDNTPIPEEEKPKQ